MANLWATNHRSLDDELLFLQCFVSGLLQGLQSPLQDNPWRVRLYLGATLMDDVPWGAPCMFWGQSAPLARPAAPESLHGKYSIPARYIQCHTIIHIIHDRYYILEQASLLIGIVVCSVHTTPVVHLTLHICIYIYVYIYIQINNDPT